MAMTSLKQIEANRHNALKSTGPTNEAGKERSRRNAVRHGLTAETVIEFLEDPEDYKAFEMSITAEFDAQTAVERELVLRLASVLWRLRRSTAIETGLLQISRLAEERPPQPDAKTAAYSVFSLMEAAPSHRSDGMCKNDEAIREQTAKGACGPEFDLAVDAVEGGNAELALRFVRLASFDDGAFERLNRYETALWRQVAQLLFTLNVLHQPPRRQSAFLRARNNPLPFGSRR
jgi:hypothetical protein